MGIFYPDNPRRMDRVHQLVDSISNMQADIKAVDKQIHDKEGKLRPAINNLLRAHGMASVGDVIDKAASKMTPHERKVFETLIQTCRNTKTDLEMWYFVAGLLIAPGGVVVSGKMAINIARWGTRILSLQGLANFVTAADAGEAAAATAAAEVAAEAEAAAGALEGVGEAAEAAEVAAEIAEVASVVASVSVFLGVLAGIGLVVGLVAGFLEAFEGAEQKEKLVKAIHGLQPARLTTAVFKREGEILSSQLAMFEAYVDASPGGSEPDPYRAKYASAVFLRCTYYSSPGWRAVAYIQGSCGPFVLSQLADRITESIRLENKEIDPDKIETELETEDRLAIAFYGGADLSPSENSLFSNTST